MFLAKYAKGPCCIYDEQRVFSNEIIQAALNYSEDREQMLEKPWSQWVRADPANG